MREAALSGVVDAQYRLGVFFWSGRGGRVDLREAVRWMCRAAENGSTLAMTTLSGFLLTGNALPLNRPSAYALLKAAANLGDASATATLPSMLLMLPPRERRQADKWVRSATSTKSLVEFLIPRADR